MAVDMACERRKEKGGGAGEEEREDGRKNARRDFLLLPLTARAFGAARLFAARAGAQTMDSRMCPGAECSGVLCGCAARREWKRREVRRPPPPLPPPRHLPLASNSLPSSRAKTFRPCATAEGDRPPFPHKRGLPYRATRSRGSLSYPATLSLSRSPSSHQYPPKHSKRCLPHRPGTCGQPGPREREGNKLLLRRSFHYSRPICYGRRAPPKEGERVLRERRISGERKGPPISPTRLLFLSLLVCSPFPVSSFSRILIVCCC